MRSGRVDFVSVLCYNNGHADKEKRIHSKLQRNRRDLVELRKIVKLGIAFAAAMMLSCIIASADTGVVTPADGLNHRSGPGTEYSVLQAFPKGTILNIEGVENGWVKCTYNSKTGYVSAQFLNIRKDTNTDRSGSAVLRSGSKGQEVVDYAAQFLGTPYVYGGTSPSGFDCSGLVYYTYKQLGYTLNRTAAGQSLNGIAVSKADLQPGDIILFGSGSGINHAGIYAGNGTFIHSPQTGDVVKYTDLNSGYYANRFVCARRIIY